MRQRTPAKKSDFGNPKVRDRLETELYQSLQDAASSGGFFEEGPGLLWAGEGVVMQRRCPAPLRTAVVEGDAQLVPSEDDTPLVIIGTGTGGFFLVSNTANTVTVNSGALTGDRKSIMLPS